MVQQIAITAVITLAVLAVVARVPKLRQVVGI